MVSAPWCHFFIYPRYNSLESFHSRGQQLHVYKFIGTKENVYIRKEFDLHEFGLEHQYGRRFIVLEHQYGCCDVMWIRPRTFTATSSCNSPFNFGSSNVHRKHEI